MTHALSFAIISALILVAPMLSRFLRLPVAACEIALGALAYNLGFITHSIALESIAEAGFLFLMLLAGMEVEVASFMRPGRAFLLRAGAYFTLLYGMSAILVLLLDLPLIFLVAFPVMSLGMIMTLIREHGRGLAWLSLALRLGILGELVSICALVIFNGIYSHGGGLELAKTLLVLVGFLALIVGAFIAAKVAFWWAPSLRLALIPKNDANSQDVRFSMMLFFVFLAITTAFGLEIVLGSFVAGMILRNFFQHKADLNERLTTLGFGFFVPLFFVFVGTTLDFSLIFKTPAILLHAILIMTAMFALHFVAGLLTFGRHFASIKNNMLFTLSCSMPLTFLVATATLALRLEAISQELYSALLIAAILESILFSTMIKLVKR